ncbi:MAG: lipopolysaccharide heptosyltransferase I [Betaproteobacteria bacterium]|nr:lipopolysaccharide heptosyltransferase I [Betaproteobacteria bacterium]
MKKILLVRLSSLGDVVHTFPAVTDIARNVPGAELDWAVDEVFAALPALHPAVSRVIPVALRRGRRNPFNPAAWRALAVLRATLAEAPYDAVLDLQGLFKSAMVARLARGPRHGHAGATAREPLASWLYDHRHPAPRGDHAVAQTRLLAASALGYAVDGPIDYGLRVPPPPAFAPQDRYAVLLHSTSRASKLWNEDNWIALGQRFESEGVRSVLPWGNEVERARAERLAGEIAEAIVAPRMSLTDAAGLLGRANVVVGLDTGLTHLAAATRTPVVGIYCDTSPADLRPIGPGPTASCGDRGAPPSLEDVAAAIIRVAPGLL